MIMDMLGNEQSRKAILQHYQRTGEPAEVESTVNKMKIPGNGVRKRYVVGVAMMYVVLGGLVGGCLFCVWKSM